MNTNYSTFLIVAIASLFIGFVLGITASNDSWADDCRIQGTHRHAGKAFACQETK